MRERHHIGEVRITRERDAGDVRLTALDINCTVVPAIDFPELILHSIYSLQDLDLPLRKLQLLATCLSLELLHVEGEVRLIREVLQDVVRMKHPQALLPRSKARLEESPPSRLDLVRPIKQALLPPWIDVADLHNMQCLVT